MLVVDSKINVLYSGYYSWGFTFDIFIDPQLVNPEELV